MNGRAHSGACSSAAARRDGRFQQEFGGESCPRPLLVQRYAQLAEGSLTAVFILSQHDAAVRRLIAAPANGTAARWLHAIGAGRAFTTVGISHLTTSRRLGPQAIKVAEVAPGELSPRRDDPVGHGRRDEQTSSSPALPWTTGGRC